MNVDSANTRASSDMTLEFYRKALNFNVIGRYDPKIKQLLFHTSHAAVYKWDCSTDGWSKLEYQGVLAIYLRDVSNHEDLLPALGNNDNTVITGATTTQQNGIGSESPSSQLLTGHDIYNYGLIIINRINPDNFSLGIAPNSAINKRKIFNPEEDVRQPLHTMGVEVKDDLLIIKSLTREVFGIWIHNESDRNNIYELIKYLLENEPKDSFT